MSVGGACEQPGHLRVQGAPGGSGHTVPTGPPTGHLRHTAVLPTRVLGLLNQ